MRAIDFLSRNRRPLILLLGFASSLTGSLGSFLFIDSLVSQLKQANAEPIRNLGPESLSGLSDSSKTYGEYERLNDVARDSGSFDDFVAVKDYERNVVQLAQKRVTDLQLRVIPETARIDNLSRRLINRRQTKIVFASADAFLLLLANLIEHRRSVSHVETLPRPVPVESRSE